ncbi:ATP-binding cassette domain-containing protein, partial [Spirillospora sp. NPDC049652]
MRMFGRGPRRPAGGTPGGDGRADGERPEDTRSEERERAAEDGPLLGPKLAEPHGWYGRADEMARTDMVTMTRQLPRLIGQVGRLGWQASRRDLLVTVVFNAVAGGFRQISVDGITFTYPGADEPALRDVSVRLRRGEVVALVGENGSGKTTLAKIIAGLYAPERGRVRWDDVVVTRLDPEVLRRDIAVVAQDHTHWPMTAADNIAMGD